MSTPSYGDTFTRVGDYLRYPKRVLLEALQSGFREQYLFTNTEDEKVENPYLYRTDEETGETHKDSKIEIVDTWTEELNDTDPRPIITVQRQEMAFGESAIRSLRDIDLPGGLWKKYADMVSMPLLFNCWSRKDIESEEIAITVAFLLRLFRDIHIARTKIDKITVPIIGGTTPVKADSEHELFVTPVSVTTHMTLAWKIEHTDPKQASSFAVNITSGE